MTMIGKLRWFARAIVIEVAAGLLAFPFRHFYKDFNGPNGRAVAEVPIPEIYVLAFAVISIVLWAVVLLFYRHWSRKIIGME